MTQLAIDRELTLIAFEAMNHWTADGHVGLHVFHKNNELAGYCSVLHAMELVGITGDYGRRLSAVVIGFGATARGAVTALNAHGVSEVAVLTNRGVAAVGSPIHSVRIRQFDHDPDDPAISHVITDRGREPLAAVPRGERHRRQLHAAGHRGAADLPADRGPRGLPAGQPGRRRVLRRGHGLRVGRARRPSTTRCSPWATASTTTPSTTARPTSGTRPPGRTARRCCRSSRPCARRARRVGRRRDDQPRDRDPRRPHPEPRDPGVPGPVGRAPLPGRLSSPVPGLREQAAGVGQQLGQGLGPADDGMKLASPGQRGTTCWCRWSASGPRRCGRG